MGLQPFAGQRDLEPPPVLDGLDLDAADIGDAFGDLFGQRKAVGEIFKIAGVAIMTAKGEPPMTI